MKNLTVGTAIIMSSTIAHIKQPIPETVDTNHNGSVTIAEAKAAGFKMPITRDSWLYKYMDDRDGDGLVGE